MKKEALRAWYPHSERILFFEQAGDGNERRSALGDFLRVHREQAGMTQHELCGRIGAYGRVNHGGAVNNWEAAGELVDDSMMHLRDESVEQLAHRGGDSGAHVRVADGRRAGGVVGARLAHQLSEMAA
jgi:hypothetical protein